MLSTFWLEEQKKNLESEILLKFGFDMQKKVFDLKQVIVDKF